jgi:hypothetical protein
LQQLGSPVQEPNSEFEHTSPQVEHIMVEDHFTAPALLEPKSAYHTIPLGIMLEPTLLPLETTIKMEKKDAPELTFDLPPLASVAKGKKIKKINKEEISSQLKPVEEALPLPAPMLKPDPDMCPPGFRYNCVTPVGSKKSKKAQIQLVAESNRGHVNSTESNNDWSTPAGSIPGNAAVTITATLTGTRTTPSSAGKLPVAMDEPAVDGWLFSAKKRKDRNKGDMFVCEDGQPSVPLNRPTVMLTPVETPPDEDDWFLPVTAKKGKKRVAK